MVRDLMPTTHQEAVNYAFKSISIFFFFKQAQGSVTKNNTSKIQPSILRTERGSTTSLITHTVSDFCTSSTDREIKIKITWTVHFYYLTSQRRATPRRTQCSGAWTVLRSTAAMQFKSVRTGFLQMGQQYSRGSLAATKHNSQQKGI